LNGKSDSEPAYTEHFKSSDIKKLGADAKIIVALMKKQPQRRIDLCKSAGIHPTTFSRYKRLMKDIIRETPMGFCLWNYVEPTSLWNRLQLKIMAVGVSLVDMRIEKFELGNKPDPITGWYEEIYEKVLPIKGIVILKGAKELEAATSIYVPKEYLGFLLTQGAVEECDRFMWRGKMYVIQEVEEVIDGYDFSYRIAKLVWQYKNKLM
jgi:hypothetical protein